MKRQNNKSIHFKDWTIKKLKTEAQVYHNLIYNIQCYGVNDLLIYDSIFRELERRNIEPKLQLEF